MERWRGKVAVVTGASAGIGAAIVKDLLKSGMIVVGLARRKERIESLLDDVQSPIVGKLYAIKCDLSLEIDISEAFKWIELNLKRVDVLINNAGVFTQGKIIDEGNEVMLMNAIHVNFVSYVLCTKQAVEIMKRMNINDGHIININSILGHKVTSTSAEYPPIYNLCAPTKYAVTALTEVLRQELSHANTKIKISSISPGAVKTEVLSDAIFEDYCKNHPVLESEDLSNAVLYVLGTPPHVQIHELIIKPVGETI